MDQPSYDASRSDFRDLADALSARRHQLPVAIESGSPLHRFARTQNLSIDVAEFGDPQSEVCLIATSGLHGVEGHFGARVLRGWMDRLLRQDCATSVGSRERPRVVLIHALNPFGMANDRRCDAANVDLNRSFFSGDAEWKEVPGNHAHGVYRDLNPLLNPTGSLGPLDRVYFYVKAMSAIARHGLPGVTQAIAEGQREFPRGLFFGGRARSPLERPLRDVLKPLFDQSRLVIHVDLHTGLGRWGQCQIICEQPVSSSLRDAWAGCIAQHGMQWRATENSVYRADGTLMSWMHGIAAERQVKLQSVIAEFGTYHSVEVLQALRVENHAYWQLMELPTGREAKEKAARRQWAHSQRTLRSVFDPPRQHWRQRTMAAAIALLDSAITRQES